MESYKKNSKGFTLIELLSVVIILGILMIIAVPSVTSYIADSRKKAYINTAQGYIKETKSMITSRMLTGLKRKDATYYIPISCIHVESGGDSPYGEWESAYVVVTYSDGEYSFYWTSNDVSNMGVLLTPENLLAPDKVESGVIGISTGIAVDDKNEIYVLGDSCSVDDAVVKEPSDDIEDDATRPIYTVAPDGWAQWKTVTIDYPGSTKKEYSLDSGVTWLEYTEPLKITVNNTNLIAKNTVGDYNVKGTNLLVTQIDPTAPTKVGFSTSATSSTIRVVATGTDPESKIIRYQFSNDGGTTWTKEQEKGTYVFSSLTSGDYDIKVRVINGTYVNHGISNNYLESEIKKVSTKDIMPPTYDVEPDTELWVQKKIVTINYASGYENEYSLDGGLTWKIYTSPLEFTNSADIIARSNDGTNFVIGSTQSIRKIDPTAPTDASFTYTTTSKSITVIAHGTDSESGISFYQFSKDGGSTWTALLENNIYTFSDLRTGIYDIKVRVVNDTYDFMQKLSNNYKDSDTISVSTNEIAVPDYDVTPEGWANKKTVEIIYPTGYTNEYSLDGGETWDSYLSDLIFTKIGTVIARVNDGVNYVTGSTLSVSQIDTILPTLSASASTASSIATVKITAADTGGSGLSSENIYQYCVSTSGSTVTGCTWTDYTNGEEFTFAGTGVKYIWVYPVKDKAGNVNGSKTYGTPYMIKEISFCTPTPLYSYGGATCNGTNCKFVNEGNGNWRIEVYSVGTKTLTFEQDFCGTGSMEASTVDIFLVGGGAGGAGNVRMGCTGHYGGGGGKVANYYGVKLNSATSYSITVGDRGYGAGQTNASGVTVGTSGSAGGASKFSGGGLSYSAAGGSVNGGGAGGGKDGGSSPGGDGADGVCAFGASSCTTKYGGAGGGGGGQRSSGGAGGATGGGSGEPGTEGYGTFDCEGNDGNPGVDKTGGGGAGGSSAYYVDDFGVTDGKGGNGGTGIIIIRNAR